MAAVQDQYAETDDEQDGVCAERFTDEKVGCTTPKSKENRREFIRRSMTMWNEEIYNVRRERELEYKEKTGLQEYKNMH